MDHNNKTMVSDAELTMLYEAVDDFYERGDTDKTCPRCGKNLLFQGTLTSYRISCEDKECISVTARGI
ncbi:hypothetical protein [Gorillibacterium sp. CAU 1737]|uniref:hypothetical protein n=1 Tax=Gorillibacterium sp. CAU 1737 TaxID=3140362 RepID=UPI003260E78A